MFVLNQDIAGTTHQIATYEFFSKARRSPISCASGPAMPPSLAKGCSRSGMSRPMEGTPALPRFPSA
jgi:hypothetical protein